MSEGPPILEGAPPTEEHKRLVALFDEMEKKQVEFLDQAGKRIIELTTALLGILFAVVALGDKFPPPYLQGNDAAKGLTVAALGFYLGAMLVSVLAVQPQEYRRYEHNVSEMRRELRKITRYKSRWLSVAGALFVLGSLTLALLISSIVFTA